MNKGLVWFRNDLRVGDNPTLTNAVEQNEQLIAVYCFDPRHFANTLYDFRKTGKFRANFLLETITQLRENLSKLNIVLLVYSEKPEGIIPHLVVEHDITAIYHQKEWTQEEVEVTEALRKELPQLSWNTFYSQFLFHPEDVPFSITAMPKVFTDFRKKCERYCEVRPLVQPKKLPASNKIENPTSIPSLDDLGFSTFQVNNKSAFPFKGGENNALDRLQYYFWESKKLSHYKKTRNGLLGTDYSSKLSPWLANGSISPRTIYFEIKAYEKEIQKNQDTYWLVFELIWRDFFKYVSLQHNNRIFYRTGILGNTYHWKENQQSLDKWIHGKSDQPFVNANMIELKETGWMSNRGRQNVASYFAKTLQLDWRIGAAYFESMLLDYDVHSNYGNWIYVAGIGNDPRDRVFNIALQASKYDPTGAFQKSWLQTQLF